MCEQVCSIMSEEMVKRDVFTQLSETAHAFYQDLLVLLNHSWCKYHILAFLSKLLYFCLLSFCVQERLDLIQSRADCFAQEGSWLCRTAFFFNGRIGAIQDALNCTEIHKKLRKFIAPFTV